MNSGRIGLRVNLMNLVATKADIAAKRHPGEIDSVFHWAGKIHKRIIYILEYQIVMGVKNINLDFLQDHQI